MEILEHDLKRLIQRKIVVLEEKLMDLGYTDAEIAEKLDEARKSLESKHDEDLETTHLSLRKVHIGNNGKDFQSLVIWGKVGTALGFQRQTHQVSALKERQMETLKAVLGIISDADRDKKRVDAEAPCFVDNSADSHKRRRKI
ncbi:hypothetical protein Sango_1202300 [Sesamum angolense]|uniref:CWF21 domain-containing protein n=1 Tax=Sesamum angolense TaxID=2727404 RepID=A0AAE1WXI8_9LAMI|nr:hypothetical protein Sango_1202300 [Sesamum angolense]